jgi:hypothetical protein
VVWQGSAGNRRPYADQVGLGEAWRDLPEGRFGPVYEWPTIEEQIENRFFIQIQVAMAHFFGPARRLDFLKYCQS